MPEAPGSGTASATTTAVVTAVVVTPTDRSVNVARRLLADSTLSAISELRVVRTSGLRYGRIGTGSSGVHLDRRNRSRLRCLQRQPEHGAQHQEDGRDRQCCEPPGLECHEHTVPPAGEAQVKIR